MAEHFSRFTLAERVNLHIQRTPKFKTIAIYTYFHLPLEPVTVTLNTLLPMVLGRASADYPTTADLSRAFDDLYGASFGADVSRRGEVHSIVFRLEVAHEQHIPGEEGLLRRGLSTLAGIIARPLIVGDGFKPEYVAQETANLKQIIEGLINDKRRYAMVRCTAAMCEGEPFALYRLGRVEDLADVTPQSLLRHHQRVLTTAPVDIFVIGDLDVDETRRLVEASLILPSAGPGGRSFPNTLIQRAPDRPVRDVVDRLDVNQGVLVIGFRTGITLQDELYFPMLVANGILGGFPHSKLFQEVREKNSLAYFAYSAVETVKGVGFMYAGIEFDDKEKAKAIMLEQLKAVQNGQISDEEYETTVETLVNDMLSASDSSGAMAELAIDQVFSGYDLSIDERVARYRQVTKEQAAEAARHFSLDTIYFLNKMEGAE